MKIFAELKRRGVLQMAVAYAVVAWLLVQVSDILLATFEAPDWAMKSIVLVLFSGFPITLALAWFYKVTSEGIIPDTGSAQNGGQAAFPGQLLNYIIIGVLAAAVLLFTLDKFLWQTDFRLQSPGSQKSVAVLPFRNLSGELSTEPFVNGIHDDLLTQLSRISALHITSRTSVMKYRDLDVSIPEIAEELGVDAVLEGAVQRSDDRIRVNAQLIDGQTDAHLWAETYDRQLTAANIFAIQSEISLAISRALSTTLSKNEQRALETIPTNSLAAYDAYAAGRASMDGMSDEVHETARQQFELATELDPDFAAAWAGLCTTHLSMYAKESDRAHFEAGRAACERALELDDSRAEVYVALGTLYRHFGQYSKAEVALQQANYAKATEALERALELDAVELDALGEMGNVLMRQGRQDEAEQYLLKAESLDPESWFVQGSLFTLYYTFSDRPDRFDRAARHAALSASLRPELAASWNNLGAANYMMGRYDLAADAWKESLNIEPNRTAYTNTGLAFYYAGNFSEAVAMQERAVALSPRDHRALGRLADALRFVEGLDNSRARESYQRAAELAEELLAVNDRDWQTLGFLAVYQSHLGDKESAEASIARALRLSERNAETLYTKALVRTIEGRNDEALRALDEALVKDASYRHLIEIDPDFSALREMPGYMELIGAG